MSNGFAVLSDDEVEDFYSSIKEHGFKEKDFELSQTPATPSGGGIQQIVGTVTVKSVKRRARVLTKPTKLAMALLGLRHSMTNLKQVFSAPRPTMFSTGRGVTSAQCFAFVPRAG
jgi:hypothetical protein